jgi:probable rRNA maturation factor
MAESGPSRNRTAGPSPSLEAEVVRHDEAWTTAKLTGAMLERAAQAAIGVAPPRGPGSYRVTIVLSDDAELRALNRTWRGKDVPTNVLSFPAHKNVAEPGFLGDVVLGYGTVEREAREQGIPLRDHAAHLVVHGVLHLLGFDHADDAEAARMEELERQALASLGIADPYAEREARPPEASP